MDVARQVGKRVVMAVEGYLKAGRDGTRQFNPIWDGDDELLERCDDGRFIHLYDGIIADYEWLRDVYHIEMGEQMGSVFGGFLFSVLKWSGK